MKEIKLWNINNDKITSIARSKLDYENRLEKWLIEDISILSENLLVIGSQVATAYGKFIDILAVNKIGEVVIIELKRDKTYREIIAQVLDYATWVKGLDYSDLNSIFKKHLDLDDLSEYFFSKFNVDPEEFEFNTDHKMLVVGSEIDDSTVRIIDYLSNEPFSVNINAANFNYFKDKNDQEFLAQSFVRPEENILEESKSKKRKRAKSIIKELFEQGKLFVGQKVYLKPALDQNIDKSKVEAIIKNTGQNCLKTTESDELYSFSGLRRYWTDKYNLTDVRKFWGFGVRFDWIDENGKNLKEILEEN